MQWAISALCQQNCLHLGDHLLSCRKVQFNGAMASLYTWRCADAEFVVLCKSADQTFVYFPSSDMVYFAKPGLEFEGADALIGQYVVDDVHGTKVGHLLVFDIMSAGTPSERYKTLQNMSCGPLISKQWCGERSALTTSFFESLPHACSGVIGLTVVPFVYTED